MIGSGLGHLTKSEFITPNYKPHKGTRLCEEESVETPQKTAGSKICCIAMIGYRKTKEIRRLKKRMENISGKGKKRHKVSVMGMEAYFRTRR